MSIRPAPMQFALPCTRASMEAEAERLATLLAETERDLARLLSILNWMDGDTDLESEDGPEDDDTEPSLGAIERHPRPEGTGREYACSQVTWAASGDSEREVEWR